MPLSLPDSGNTRRRHRANSRKKRGIYPGHTQDKLAEKQAKWDALELSNPKAKERLSQISLKSARGFQAPQTDFGIWDQLRELYAMLVDMSEEERDTLLDELCTFYRKRRGAVKYGSLVQAGCAPWYDNSKRVSWAARLLRDAIKAKVSLKKFEDFCEGYGKS